MATLTLDPRPSNKEVDARYFIENAPDALDMPGEWYLDRKTHAVTYWPVAGENMAAEQVVAPALVQLVRLEGKPEAGEFVRNVTFRGLQFAHADWSMDPKGYADTQAAVPAPAAIEGTGAVECKLERCTVAHSGGYAIYFGRGSKRNQVLACELFDLGGGGIKLGEPGQSPDDTLTELRERDRRQPHPRSRPGVRPRRRRLGGAERPQPDRTQPHSRSLLHRDFRGLDVGLCRQSVQGQHHRVQPPARHRQRNAQRHGRHLHPRRCSPGRASATT